MTHFGSSRGIRSAARFRAGQSIALAITLGHGLGGPTAAAEGPLPDSAKILKSDAYVAEYSKSMGGRAVLRRGQEPVTEIEPGQLLYASDIVEIAAGRPRVAIKSPGRERLVYLPEDGNAFRVAARRAAGSGGSVIPNWIRNLFAPQQLTRARSTMARDPSREEAPEPSAECDEAAPAAQRTGPAAIKPVVQILSSERLRVTVIWQDLPIGRVEVGLKDGSVLFSKEVTGRSTALSVDRTNRERFERVRLYRDDGRLAMDISVRFAGVSTKNAGSRAASDEKRLVSALNDLRQRCARGEKRTLETMSLIADQKDRSLAAAVVFEAITHGDVRW